MKKILGFAWVSALAWVGLSVNAPAMATAALIEDPHAHLKEIEDARAWRSFSDAYRLNDQATIRLLNKNCIFGCDAMLGNFLCGSVCESWDASWPDYPTTIVEATEESATAVRGDGAVEIFDRLEFDAGRGGMLRKLLTELDVFTGLPGKVVLTNLTSIDQPMTGQDPVPAYRLEGEYAIDAGGALDLEIIVGKDTPGVAEVLFLRIGSTKIFRVRSIAPRSSL